MIILALECSAKSASAAISRDGALIAQYFQNSGLTHSKTLLPMAEDILKGANLTIDDIDAIAVSQGPGSFTGVRIGVAAVKGLCWGADKNAIGVSTLEAMAWNGEYAPAECIICCSMDARRNQVYNALFEIKDGIPCRLTPDRAISLEELKQEAISLNKTFYMVGDGASLCYNYFCNENLPAILSPEASRMQNAWGVCRAASGKEAVSADQLLPVYLRLSQAERERLAKQKESN